MFGDTANKLILDAKRSSNLSAIPIYQSDLVKSIVRETNDLNKDAEYLVEEQEQLQDSMFNINPQVNDKYNDGALIKNQSLYQPRHGSTFNNSIELNTQASTLGLKFLGNQTTFGSQINYNTQNKNMNSKYSSQTIQKAQSKFEKNFDIKFNCN